MTNETAPADRPVPEAQAIRSAIDALTWDTGAREASVLKLYEFAQNLALTNIELYDKSKDYHRYWSQRLRQWSIAAVAAGVVAPFLSLLTGFYAFTICGYLFFAVAAGFYVYDSWYGHSSSWIRLLRARNALAAQFDLFRVQWAEVTVRRSGLTGTEADQAFLDALALIRDFLDQAHQTTTRETETWVAQYMASLVDLDTFIKKRQRPDKTAAAAPSGTPA